MSDDLSLVPFDDLMKELHKRFDVWVFSGMQVRNKEEGTIFTTRKWGGNSTMCGGLVGELQIAIYDTKCKEAVGEIDSSLFEE